MQIMCKLFNIYFELTLRSQLCRNIGRKWVGESGWNTLPTSSSSQTYHFTATSYLLIKFTIADFPGLLPSPLPVRQSLSALCGRSAWLTRSLVYFTLARNVLTKYSFYINTWMAFFRSQTLSLSKKKWTSAIHSSCVFQFGSNQMRMK